MSMAMGLPEYRHTQRGIDNVEPPERIQSTTCQAGIAQADPKHGYRSLPFV
jgi:hypothetical protein